MVSAIERDSSSAPTCAFPADSGSPPFTDGSLTEIEGSIDRSASEQIIELVPVAICVCDADDKIVFHNRRASELWRWPPNSGMAKGARDWFIVIGTDGEPVAAEANPLHSSIREGKPCRNMELVLRRHDGSSFEASVNIDPTRDPNGRICGAIAVVVDISEGKRRDRHDALLGQLSERLTTATDEAEIVRVTTRMVGEHLNVQRCGFVENERRSGMIKVIPGWMREPLPSLAGRHDVQALGNARWQRALGSAKISIDDVTAHPHTRAYSEYYRARGVLAYAGAPFHRDSEWVATLTVTSNEPRVWTPAELVLLEDVVARVWPLIERVRSQTVLRLVTSNAPVVLAYMDRESRIVFANHAFASRWGMMPEEVVERHLADVIGQEAYDIAKPCVEKVLSGQPVECEIEVPYRELGKRFVRISYAPDADSAGFVRGYLSAVSDLTERRTAELARAESEERFRALAQNAPVGIYQTDPSGARVFVNDQWCRMAGITVEEALGFGWLRAVHPDDRERVWADWQALVRDGRPFKSEHRFMRPDGLVVWLQSSSVEYRDSKGGVLGYIGTVMDITERKLAEFALRESEKRFRLVASRAPVGIFMTDASGGTEFVNASWCEMSGLSLEEARGLGWIEAVHPDDRRQVTALWDEAVRESSASKAEFRFVRRDGTITWVHGTAVPLRNTSGRLMGHIGTVADFTERKQVELALRESEERFRMLADNIMQFAWICDPAGRLVWVNRRCLDYAGLPIDQLGGGSLVALHHPDYSARASDKFQRYLLTGDSWEDSFPLRGSDGAYRWFLSRATPIMNADGKITRWFGTNTDITDWRETQEMLRKAQEELLVHAGDLERNIEARTASLRDAIVQMEEFSYSVSHDLRAPLRAMNAYAEALIQDYGAKLDDTARDYLGRIQRSSQRMETLTHDILTYSRIARAEIVPVPVDVASIVRDLVGQYAELQPDSADLVVREPLLRVQGHELSLGQCLGNLLTNAAKFVAPGVKPRIEISTVECDDAFVRVCVSDNGIGVLPEHQRNLFRIFERVPTPIPYEGTGIGLAIVRKAVERMGGRWGVESDGKSGSCFWIELPKSDQ